MNETIDRNNEWRSAIAPCDRYEELKATIFRATNCKSLNYGESVKSPVENESVVGARLGARVGAGTEYKLCPQCSMGVMKL